MMVMHISDFGLALKPCHSLTAGILKLFSYFLMAKGFRAEAKPIYNGILLCCTLVLPPINVKFPTQCRNGTNVYYRGRFPEAVLSALSRQVLI
jgi:hypothetical protein